MATSLRRPKLKVKEIEVECARPAARGSKLESVNLMLTIVRGPRGRRKLLGEAFVRLMYQPFVHFKVYDDGDMDRLFQRFLGQLVHRGYRPLRSRQLDIEERWGEWEPCSLKTVDMSELDDASSSPMGVLED